MPDTLTTTLVVLSLVWASILTYRELRQEKVKLEKKLEDTQQRTYSIVPNMDEWFLHIPNGKVEYWDDESEGINLMLEGYLIVSTFTRIQVESIDLDLAGERFQSDWVSSEQVGYNEPSIKFDLPLSTQRGKRTATLRAIIDGKTYTSESFILDFPEKKRVFHMEGSQKQ